MDNIISKIFYYLLLFFVFVILAIMKSNKRTAVEARLMLAIGGPGLGHQFFVDSVHRMLPGGSLGRLVVVIIHARILVEDGLPVFRQRRHQTLLGQVQEVRLGIGIDPKTFGILQNFWKKKIGRRAWLFLQVCKVNEDFLFVLFKFVKKKTTQIEQITWFYENFENKKMSKFK